jgi:hypothetical protein
MIYRYTTLEMDVTLRSKLVQRQHSPDTIIFKLLVLKDALKPKIGEYILSEIEAFERNLALYLQSNPYKTAKTHGFFKVILLIFHINKILVLKVYLVGIIY